MEQITVKMKHADGHENVTSAETLAEAMYIVEDAAADLVNNIWTGYLEKVFPMRYEILQNEGTGNVHLVKSGYIDETCNSI